MVTNKKANKMQKPSILQVAFSSLTIISVVFVRLIILSHATSKSFSKYLSLSEAPAQRF